MGDSMSKKITQGISDAVFTLSGVLTLVILLVIAGYILFNGLSFVDLEFLISSPQDSGRKGGIFPMILSTFYLIIITLLIAVPIGVGSAIYMSEYATNEKLINCIRFVCQTLASIPSIIFGLFGLSFFVFFLNLGWSILVGGIVLALMAIPTIFQVSEVTLRGVPESYKEGCYGLGATKWQAICSVILPIALPGIVTGIILALTRAISEAAAVMYVVGSSLDVPISILDAGRPLPLHLYILASEGISISNAYATASVLVIIVLSITLFTNFFVNRYQNKTMGVKS